MLLPKAFSRLRFLIILLQQIVLPFGVVRILQRLSAAQLFFRIIGTDFDGQIVQSYVISTQSREAEDQNVPLIPQSKQRRAQDRRLLQRRLIVVGKRVRDSSVLLG